MPGQFDQGDNPWETPSTRHRAALNGNGTGKSHAIPQRPPGMARIDQPPPMQRVARPKPESPAPKRTRRTFLLIGTGLLICALLACTVSYIAFNYFNSISVGANAAKTANDFLAALSGPHPNYAQAYSYLGPSITLQHSQQDFQTTAANNDRCFGMITNYSEVPNSANTQDTSQSYLYNVTRSKTGSTPYQLRLSMQEDTNANTWKITSYGDSLGPGQPTCK